MSLTPTSKNNPCQLCDDATGKCRQGREDQDYWQCMSYADSRKGEIVNGFKCIGHTHDQLWGQFRLDINTGRHYEQRILQKNSRSSGTPDQRTASSIPVLPVPKQTRNYPGGMAANSEDVSSCREKSGREANYLLNGERDRAIRKLHSYFRLSGRHREDLRKRGLTDSQIDHQLYFSITPNQEVPFGISVNLPGVKEGKIKGAGTGYACVIFNPQGEATGWQIRLDDATDNKYRWAKGEVSSHLANGELPITSVYPSEIKHPGIWISEGISKPAIASHRLGIVTLGAASANFASSPQQTEEHLRVASERLGTKEIIFAPDAGATKNSHILKTYKRTWELFTELGYQLKVAWWGQASKDDFDIDELTDYSRIEFITPDEFIKFAPSEKQSTPQKKGFSEGYQENANKQKLPRLGFNCFKEPNLEFEEKIRQVQRKLRSLSYQADIQLDERYLPRDLVCKLPKSGLIGIKAPKGSGKSVSLKRIIAEAKKQRTPILSITPRIALGREQAIKWEITWIDDYGAMQTRAEDTTAQIREIAKKMETAKEKLAELEQINCQLNLLGEDETEKPEQQKQDLRVEIERYEEEIENVNAASIRTLALCWDSLWRTKDRDLKNGLIIVDEAELGLKHFVSGSTCKRNRPYLLQVFKEKLIECLMSGGRVILSDADLTDLPINYIRQILPIPINPFIVVSEYIGEETRWIVDFRSGSRGNTLTDTIEKLKDGDCLAFTSDSQAEAQALEKLILQEFPDDFCAFLDGDGSITDEAQARKKALIVRIDRTTTETEVGKKFIQKPNEQILFWKPRVLIYTPSMGVGVSIDESTQRWDEGWEITVPYFDAVIGAFFGVIEPSQCRQQLSRIRANVPRIVWCKESNHALEGCSSFFPDEVKRQTLKYNHSALNIIDVARGIAGYEADDEEIREAMLQLLTDAWDKDSRCWKEPSIDLASAFKARENYGLWNLANLLREELEDEGHTVISLEGVKSDLVEEMALIKDDQKMEEATLIAESLPMPVEEARQVINKLGETKERYRSAQKSLLQEELPEIQFTPAFIKKAVIDDRRRWLSQHKLFWYLTNDEALKQIDTDHWLGNLKRFAEGIPFMRDIRSYSPKVEALRKSGVFEFVDLEDCDRIYQGDSLEAQAFLKRCLKQKDSLQTALNILITKKSSPIKLVNRILGKVGLALEKLTRSNKDSRWKLSTDLANDPDRANVLKAFELRWQITQEEAEKKLAEKQAQTQIQQAVQLGGELADYIYTNQSFPPHTEEISQRVCEQVDERRGYPAKAGLTSTGCHVTEGVTTEGGGYQVTEAIPVDELVQAFEFCDTPADFSLVTEGYTPNQIESAIALQDSHPRRQQLNQWWESLTLPLTAVDIVAVEVVEEVIALPKAFAIGQRLRGMRGTLAQKIAKVTEVFGDWCDTTLGPVAMSEVEGGSWTFV